MIPEIGIHKNIPAQEYHAWQAFSISNGLEILKSPGHYKYRLLNPIEPTPQMELGTFLHMRTLESESYSQYAIAPALDKRTKAYKDFIESCAGVKYISNDVATKVEAMYLNLIAKESVNSFLLEAGETELSIVWKDELSGILCKGRLDKICRKYNTLVDLKTTKSADIDFKDAIFRYHYHVQQAHYKAGAQALGIDIDHCVIVAVENTEPHGVLSYELSNKTLLLGSNLRRRMLEAVAHCEKEQTWNLYPDFVLMVEPPTWAYYE